jgi:glucose/mannose transport system permease protein
MVDATLKAIEADPAEALASRRYFLGRLGVYSFLSLFAFIYLLPLFVVVANSFRPLPESRIVFRSGLGDKPGAATA